MPGFRAHLRSGCAGAERPSPGDKVHNLSVVFISGRDLVQQVGYMEETAPGGIAPARMVVGKINSLFLTILACHRPSPGSLSSTSRGFGTSFFNRPGETGKPSRTAKSMLVDDDDAGWLAYSGPRGPRFRRDRDRHSAGNVTTIPEHGDRQSDHCRKGETVEVFCCT